MIEAPLLIRPYLARMGRGELFALMSCGLAGVAGTVMVIYAGFLAPRVPDALGNILAASVISTPAALAVAALMVPFGAAASGSAALAVEDPATGALDARGEGHDGRHRPARRHRRAAGRAVALVALVNMLLGLLPGWAARRSRCSASSPGRSGR